MREETSRSMKITIFGATGSLGSECLSQSLEAGHDVSVLVRNSAKLPQAIRDRVTLVQGDALVAEDVERALPSGTEAVVFAIGVDKGSPEDLCTDITRHILAAMQRNEIQRFVWCGGGSTAVEGDQVSFGSRFVEVFARTFMGLRHRDKDHQFELLKSRKDVDWFGIRPLQMRSGPRRAEYRVGFDRYSGLSVITFADCAHEMLHMLTDDTWRHRAPIIQY
jgi:putative NADH-flavin reductase